jgi:phage terminase small subunit
MVLSPRQRLFVGGYLICPNAAKAAREVGYSEKTADRQGSRLLRNAGVLREIEKLRARQERRLDSLGAQ